MSSMGIRQVTLIVVCIHLLHVSSSQIESMGERRGSMRYCGRQLAMALKIVCNGVYNQPFDKKSSENDMMPPEVIQADEGSDYRDIEVEDIVAPAYPFQPKSRATALKPKSFRRAKRGIHDECCRKSCTLNEIASYCGRR
ncbi:LIRP-like [Ischnura elegans]|uniref:LIRP-like n=1 Tax=Ischnura elegans TaxID=197161 RepID=UPI001ED89D3B|nr:LIRP-like [Ischnura elegans]